MRTARSAMVLVLLGGFLVFNKLSLFSQTPPILTSISTNLPQVNLTFPPYPAAQAYTFLSSTNLDSGFLPDTNFFAAAYNLATNVTMQGAAKFTNVTANYVWRRTNAPDSEFYKLQVTPMSSDAALAVTALNRLSYGPTPDELDRVLNGPNPIGPQAFIDEQLAPWNIVETVDLTHTNVSYIQSKFCQPTNLVSASTNAGIADLRAWHILRAVGAKRQLLEILLQFLENHFVTQFSKTALHFQTYYVDGPSEDRMAAQFEYLENQKWRDALLNPQCTFYDLLKISAESPAMIIYLDTVGSKGNAANIANENYARELMELFTMGVDNGYDQNDITVMSRCWTGWSVEMVDLTNAFNPFAKVTSTIIPGSTNLSTTTRSNLVGTWSFNYKSANHNTSDKTIFPGKMIPARFGPPYTTKTYATNMIPGLYALFVPGRSGTNGIQEGYDVIQRIASLPFAEEFICIKLCRLLVHDDFSNPSNDPNNPAYALYNYAGGQLSPEADLVHQCMLTWESSNPPGQIWPVLSNIFNSDLFRGQGAAAQKIKTPLEFTVSAIRALRSSTNGSNLAGSFTAYTDGYAVGGSSRSSQTPLSRMGNMLLFDRDAPDGYPEAGPAWISAGTVAERLRFVQSLCTASGQSGHGGITNDAGNSVCDPVGLLKVKLPAASWTNAPAVADYFLGLLYPGEGNGNLQLYQASATSFLETDDSGAPSPFAKLTVSAVAGSTYDNRVRGMVGMLMTFQRFQEQ